MHSQKRKLKKKISVLSDKALERERKYRNCNPSLVLPRHDWKPSIKLGKINTADPDIAINIAKALL